MNVQPIGTAPPAAVSEPAPALRPAPQAPAKPADSQPTEGSPQPADPTQVRKAVEDVQEFVNTIAQDLHFSLDQDTGRTVVKVIDRQTEEVLRQIPSEEMLQIAKALDKLSGLLLRQKA